MAIGGFVVVLLLVTGLVILPIRRLPRIRPGRRTLLAAPILVLYAAAAIALPLQLGHQRPPGRRPLVVAGRRVGGLRSLFAYGAERLAGGNSLGVLAASAVVTGALVVAALAGLTSTFLVLVVPLLVVLQLWQAFWSATLHRFAAPTWLIALVGSPVVAWPLATTLPLVS